MEKKYENFEWGSSSQWFKDVIKGEFFDVEKNIYESIFEVEENDVVMDVGASIGPFSYCLKDRNIKHLYAIEPSESQIKVLSNNIKGMPHTIIPNVVNDKDLKIYDNFGESGEEKMVTSKKFMSIVEENNITVIDFLKTDCEGGEYEIFNVENICWLKNNVKKISGEWHLDTIETKQNLENLEMYS